MPVQRALIIAAVTSAALALTGCGSSDGDTASVQTPAADVAPAPAPDASTPASTDSSSSGDSSSDTSTASSGSAKDGKCTLKGAEQALTALPGAKLSTATDGSCTWKKGKELLNYQFAAGSTLTKSGKYPDLYTVFQKAAKSSRDQGYKDVDLGETGYTNSAISPSTQAAATWVQDGNVLGVKLSGFPASDAGRTAAVADCLSAAKKASAKL